GDDYVERAAIPQIHQRYRTSIVNIGRADGLSHIDKPPRPVIQPNALVLITRKAAPVECWPVFCIANNSTVSAGDFREVIPVTSIAVEGDVTIRQIKIERSI